jgi:YesN/AraC family two-component response regulator
MPMKILVVEDESDLEFLMTRKFRDHIRTGEFQFLFASNGVEALKILEADPDIYIVLSDIRMPQMDGLTLLAHLNEHYPLVRTIIISAYNDISNIRTAMNRGAYDFLTKPVDFKDLEVTLNKTIRHVQQVLQEVTERKKAEEQLVRLKKAVEDMRLGVTISSLDGKILYTNPAEARMHGYHQVEDLIGQDVGILAPPERREPMTLAQIKQWNGSIRESVNVPERWQSVSGLVDVRYGQRC